MAKSQSKKGHARYRTAWSNECFELWLLLHFIPLEAPSSRKQYKEKLKKKVHLPGYHKSAKDVFSQLRERAPDAIQRAKSLEERHGENTPPSQRNPGTKMHELVEELLQYIS